jgi:hypothetical protein
VDLTIFEKKKNSFFTFQEDAFGSELSRRVVFMSFFVRDIRIYCWPGSQQVTHSVLTRFILIFAEKETAIVR